MTAPVRLRLSRARGWRKPEGAVVVARPTPWGNPWEVGRHGTRAQVVARYALLTSGAIDLGSPVGVDAQLAVHRHQLAHRTAIEGRDLCCWCGLDGPCHADVLLALAAGRLADLAELVFGTELRPTVYMRYEDLVAARAAAAERARA